MKLIGTGLFSKAYLLTSGMVEIHSTDNAKEGLTVFPSDNLHLPKIERIAEGKYIMPLYSVPCTYANLCSNDAKDLKEIRRALGGKYQYAIAGYETFQNRIECFDIQETLKEALSHIVMVMANYHRSFGLEFYNRNMKVSENRLILLDVIYSLENYKLVNGQWVRK
jgi:hypothetical protein